MPHNLSKIKPWFFATKKLAALGFFQVKKESFFDKPVYNSNVVFHTKAFYSTDPLIFLFLLKKIYPLIAHIVLNSGIFFFLSLGESGFVLFDKFATLLKKSKITVVFDWGFGVLTNRSRLYFNYFLEGKFSLEEFPEIAFLLCMSGRQKVVTTELRRVKILSIGLADYGNSGSLDYPLACNVSAEYVYIFFRMMIYLVAKEQKRLGFYNITMSSICKKKN